MKKILLIGIIAILAGCGDHDEAYYFKHQDKAKETLQSCEKRLENALMSGDEKSFESLMENTECKAADAALKKQRRLDYEKAEAERERLKKLEEEKRLQAIAEEKAIIRQEHAGKTWQQNISEYLKIECQTGFMQTPTAQCAAWEEYYQDAVAEGREALLQFSFEDLKERRNEFCNLDQRRGSACEVWEKARNEKGSEALAGLDLFALEDKKVDYCDDQSAFSTICQTWKNAWRAKSDELVTLLTNNDDLFVESYNTCFNEIERIQQSESSWREKSQGESAIRNMSPCTQAATAYQRRGMGYSPYKAPIAQ